MDYQKLYNDLDDMIKLLENTTDKNKKNIIISDIYLYSSKILELNDDISLISLIDDENIKNVINKMKLYNLKCFYKNFLTNAKYTIKLTNSIQRELLSYFTYQNKNDNNPQIELNDLLDIIKVFFSNKYPEYFELVDNILSNIIVGEDYNTYLYSYSLNEANLIIKKDNYTIEDALVIIKYISTMIDQIVNKNNPFNDLKISFNNTLGDFNSLAAVDYLAKLKIIDIKKQMINKYLDELCDYSLRLNDLMYDLQGESKSANILNNYVKLQKETNNFYSRLTSLVYYDKYLKDEANALLSLNMFIKSTNKDDINYMINNYSIDELDLLECNSLKRIK
ncbi:MAG: hypothetical protein IJ574_03075 [Bacilli bacterium]|nr:hypothetical protein [Bacilli bacterium]